MPNDHNSFSAISMRRIRMKFHAKRALPGNWMRSIFLAVLFSLAISFTLGMIAPYIDPELVKNPPETLQLLFQELFPEPITKKFLLRCGVMLLLYWLVVSPLRVGFTRFFIGVARLQKPRLPVAFAIFCDLGLVLRSMGLSFLVGFLQMFWILLFLLLPACTLYAAFVLHSALIADLSLILCMIAMLLSSVKALSYTPATYLFADDPSIGVFGAVKQSVSITRGHLVEFYLFDLSFLLWRLLASSSPLIGNAFYLPYYHTALAVFVDSLRVRNDPSLAPQPKEEAQDE